MANDAFDPVATARRVLRLAATGTLATLGAGGFPFASLVTVATTPAGEPILLLSDLAVHTRNLNRDPRASLLLVGPGGGGSDPLAGARLTLVGTVSEPDGDALLRRRFLARHNEAAGYAGFADFAFRRFTIGSTHLVAGFGRIVDIPGESLLIDLDGAGELMAAEESAIDHMNADHAEAVVLYATRLLGLPDGPWRVTGADPGGIDLRAGAMYGRLDFPDPVTTPGALRRMLANLAKRARENP